MEKWYSAKETGKLYIEQVLVHGDEPVLFVCINDNGQRYLCMAYEPQMLRFVMIKITADELLNMLENRVSMEKTFRSADLIFTTDENEKMDSDVDLLITANNPATFPSDHLPEPDAYYNLSFDWVNDYIALLKNEQTDSELEITIPYTQPNNRSIVDNFEIVYKAARLRSTYESVVEAHVDSNLSANYDMRLDVQNGYPLILLTDFDNRAA